MPKPSIQHELNPIENQTTERYAPNPADPETRARLAYELWLQRGSPDGSPEEDWFQAERLLESGAGAGTATARAKS